MYENKKRKEIKIKNKQYLIFLAFKDAKKYKQSVKGASSFLRLNWQTVTQKKDLSNKGEGEAILGEEVFWHSGTLLIPPRVELAREQNKKKKITKRARLHAFSHTLVRINSLTRKEGKKKKKKTSRFVAA